MDKAQTPQETIQIPSVVLALTFLLQLFSNLTKGAYCLEPEKAIGP